MFAKYLVTFNCENLSSVEIIGQREVAQRLTYSGFIVEIRGHWCICTAGHCIEEIRSLLSAGQDLRNWVIDDSAIQAPPGRLPLPFSPDFTRDIHLVTHEEYGLDYALILLSDLTKLGLQSNGIRAIDVRKLDDPFERADYWVLCGVPAQTIVDHHTADMVTKEYTGIVIKPLEQEPEDWPNPKDAPRLYGQLYESSRPEDNTLNIAGMSGGPLFSLVKNTDDTYLVKLIGIQSAWWPERRIIAACPAAPLFDALERSLRELEQAEEAESPADGA
ncbi:hypothetical protein B551_0222830 [Cupriavidus sp. HPC(L)]|nr:hypothetical protein B551_0222830 [Cupriavidus sp. HPC(L)]